jgi:transcription elongation GreA/GreB family factor
MPVLAAAESNCAERKKPRQRPAILRLIKKLSMHKPTVHQLIIDKLRIDLDIAERAAQTAYETATHEENIAENKYDTLGLEASYLAAGQARRVEEIRQSLALCQNLTLRPYDDQRGIEVGALLGLEDEKGREQWLFLAPDAAGLKIDLVGQWITVITPRSPLGKSLLGKFEGDEVEILVAGARQQFSVTEVI